jgi:two-component system sensor histidine kinase KdpD
VNAARECVKLPMSQISPFLRAGTLPSWLRGGLAALGLVGAITAAGLAAGDIVSPATVPVLLLAAVVLSALAGGRLAAMLAAGLGFLAYDICFVEPRWTLTVTHSAEVLALVAFIGVAIVTGTLAARVGEHAATARRQSLRAEALLEFSDALSTAYGLDAVVKSTARQIAATMRTNVVVLAERDGSLSVVASAPAAAALDRASLAAAETALRKRISTGASTNFEPDSALRFMPVISAQRVLAVVGLEATSLELRGEASQLLDGMLAQAAIAIDRALRARDTAQADLLRESERLQSSLLTSLSHDLRTPLASITGAASSLRQLGDKLDAATHDDLLASIEEDAALLNRFVSNLLDMTRIEAGRLKVRQEPVDVREVIERAVARIAILHPGFSVDTSVEAGMLVAEIEPILLEQVVFNLLDNARKYAGTNEPVTIFLREEASGVVISVTDRGTGIAAADLDRIFDKFFRRGERGTGTGLGLSVARGFINAMGGTITAESPAVRNHGTRFVIRLPSPKAGMVRQ